MEMQSNLLNMPTIDLFKDIESAKEQLQIIQVSIATFTSLWLEQELSNETNFHNTYIIINYLNFSLSRICISQFHQMIAIP